jgi:hypothetical protein
LLSLMAFFALFWFLDMLYFLLELSFVLMQNKCFPPKRLIF